MLKSRGYYSFTTSEGKLVELLFNTWAFKKYCEVEGLSLSDFFAKLEGSIGLHDLVELVYSAALSNCAKEKKAVDFTEYEVTEWIDDMMFNNKADGVTGIITALKQWINPDIEARQTEETEEKKS